MKYSEHQDKVNELKAQISKLEDELYDSVEKYVMENQESILNQWWEFDPDYEKPERTFFQPTEISQIDEHQWPVIAGTAVVVSSNSVRLHKNVMSNLVLDGFLLGLSTSWEPVEADEVDIFINNAFDFQEIMEEI